MPVHWSRSVFNIKETSWSCEQITDAVNNRTKRFIILEITPYSLSFLLFYVSGYPKNVWLIRIYILHSEIICSEYMIINICNQPFTLC